jgi:asparagine synthase (glutamine-hydrolysing)
MDLSGRPIDPEFIREMLVTRPERSPDGLAVWQDGPVVLGHGLLRLLPEENREQHPLQDEELTLAADIRLDNRRELSEGLGLGHEKSAAISDTRLLSLAYRQWGTDCLTRLLGDFAFVLWDSERRHLFAARDPLGERGLCYTIHKDLCLIASDVSHLLGYPGLSRSVNDNRIAAYLARLTDSPQDTYYRDIFNVLPGSGLLINPDGIRQWRYWAIDPRRTIHYKREADYADQYRGLLTEAVRCRLRAEGDIGVSLSGGLDSSAIAALAAPVVAAERGKPLQAFSYAFEELLSCDERGYISRLVDRYPISPHYLICDDQWPLKDGVEWPVSPDTVLSDSYALLPATAMESAGKAGVRLLLTGYYGDVLFSGAHYWALDLARHSRIGTLARMTAANISHVCWRRSFFEFGLRRLVPVEISQSYRRWRPRSPKAISPGISRNLVNQSNLQERLSPQDPARKEWPPGLWERYQSLSPDRHAKGYASVRYQYNHHGVEVAQPYYDRRLIEFIMAVPAYILGGPDIDRRLHRQAMAGILPEEIRLRRERTVFTPLMDRGFSADRWAKVRQIMAKPQVVERGYIDDTWLRQGLDRGWNRSPDASFLWRVLCLELWLQRYWS